MSEPATGGMSYPIAGFPKVTDSALEDWVLIDGSWHHFVYVWVEGRHPLARFPRLYIDGAEAVSRSNFAWYDRALTQDEIKAHYEAAQRNTPLDDT